MIFELIMISKGKIDGIVQIYARLSIEHSLLANVNSCSRSLYVVVRPSVVCLSSVCLSSVVCTTDDTLLLSRLKFSAMFLRHLIRW